MRLDKYLSLAGIASRTETSKAVRGGEVLVDGVPAKKADMQVDPDTVQVTFKGQPVTYRQFTYILMHKPDGVVSATEDGREQTVLDLLPEELRRIRPALFPCGRLDKHTTGLMLLTNNGDLSHRLLSPRPPRGQDLRLCGEVPPLRGGRDRPGERRGHRGLCDRPL